MTKQFFIEVFLVTTESKNSPFHPCLWTPVSCQSCHICYPGSFSPHLMKHAGKHNDSHLKLKLLTKFKPQVFRITPSLQRNIPVKLVV